MRIIRSTAAGAGYTDTQTGAAQVRGQLQEAPPESARRVFVARVLYSERDVAPVNLDGATRQGVRGFFPLRGRKGWRALA